MISASVERSRQYHEALEKAVEVTQSDVLAAGGSKLGKSIIFYLKPSVQATDLYSFRRMTGKTLPGEDDQDYLDEAKLQEEEEDVVPPHSERRSKLVHDPAAECGKGVATVTQSSNHPRTTSPVPIEKAPKQSRVAPSKSAKVLPKMKMVIPSISG